MRSLTSQASPPGNKAPADATIEQMSRQWLFSRDVIGLLTETYGRLLVPVLDALKKPPPYYSIRVNTLKATVSKVSESLAKRGIHTTVHPDVPEALLLDVKGPFEIKSADKHVVVDKFTAEAVLLGAHVYAPGVKRCQGLNKGEAVSICDIHGQTIAAGVARMGETEILRTRAGLAVEVLRSRYHLPSFRESEEFQRGWIYPQSIPAMVAIRVLDPQPGETIVDLNCSPGGKLSHAAQLTQGESLLIGVDRNCRKVEAARETLDRLGCGNFTLITGDSRYLHEDHPYLAADKCIVDPPCSALGVGPKLYDTTTRREVEALSNYQKQFLRVAARVLKPGGRIVYCVCTVTPQECEQVARFAQYELGLTVEHQQPFIGYEGFDEFFERGHQTQRFHPHIHGCGFYIASFEKPR